MHAQTVANDEHAFYLCRFLQCCYNYCVWTFSINYSYFSFGFTDLSGYNCALVLVIVISIVEATFWFYSLVTIIRLTKRGFSLNKAY